MFPKTKEVVEVVFGQVLSNHVDGMKDISTQAKIHAEVTGILNIMYGDFVDRVEIRHHTFESVCEVHFSAEDPYIVWVEYDWTSQEFTKGFA